MLTCTEVYSTQFNNVRRHAWWQVTRELLAIVYEHVVPKVRGVPVNDDLCHDIVLFSATFNDFYLLQRYALSSSTDILEILVGALESTDVLEFRKYYPLRG